MDKAELGKWLIVIGALIALIEAIMGFLSPAWFGIIGPIVALIISVVILLSVFRPGDPIPYTPIVELILAILLIIFASWIGGIIAIIGAILLFLD